MKLLINCSLFAISITIIMAVFIHHITLPIVAFNQSGDCVYIDTEQGRQTCDIIPNKYIIERVQ